MIGWVRAGLAFFVVALITLPGLAFQFIAMRTGLFDPGILPNVWHRIVARILGLRVKVHGKPSRDRPLLLAANHVSWADIVVLGSIMRLSFIAKSEMRDWPIIGTFARVQRVVFVEREKRGKSGKQAGEIARRLAAHDVMVLFAEGTTSDGNLMLPFKSTLFGAAQVALREGDVERVAVQPVALVYTRRHGIVMGRRERAHIAWIGDSELVPHLLSVLRGGGFDVEVRFGQPLDFTASSSRKDVARTAEAEVRAMLARGLRGRDHM